MILGIGLDIVELERIKKALDKNHDAFSKRILTTSELVEWQEISNEGRKVEFLAGRFAVKEAAAKAFGTGIGEVSFQDVCVFKDAKGKPGIHLTGNAKKMAAEMAVEQTWVSITHSSTYAIAQVILEKIRT
ncbi:hypothetical protein BHF68_10795 [Desulfuribacillus alkaliarsenatis]|uniref:Holo-[acyl-carrier-protein] synthase n=1 Tax=Desulfuribacillus alkaliarsenatis TaxID=766136 RepID=A0A1E5FZ69_9FIRM|nr:holo-ACP synthase [Desulfuribacillus alkaliarsenatis]OEF95874.1 hypothetical protein BHF68_10795 [Desulfuribacillus alkaliarsenatis]